MRAYLHLEDGTTLSGEHFGYKGDSQGEVVFSTGMTGYCESITDPSFAGQILTFTYPLLGNYGVPRLLLQAHHLAANFESERVWVQGVIVSSLTRRMSHYDAYESLSAFLLRHKVPGIAGIDTRALTLKLREYGVLKGKITMSEKKVDFSKMIFATDAVAQTSLPEIVDYAPTKPNGKRLILIDCGLIHGLLRALLAAGYHVKRIPWNEDPMKHNKGIDGVVCSNGPGDPKDCVPTIENIRKVVAANMPFLGICLGHQLLALAIGADTYKLKYGHRGINQPCMDLMTQKCYITSQNHGYAVNVDTLPAGYVPWFKNLNDGTNEGIKATKKLVRSVQFHPEGYPGPYDSEFIFDMFKGKNT